jgi:hypothetical protein
MRHAIYLCWFDFLIPLGNLSRTQKPHSLSECFIENACTWAVHLQLATPRNDCGPKHSLQVNSQDCRKRRHQLCGQRLQCSVGTSWGLGVRSLWASRCWSQRMVHQPHESLSLLWFMACDYLSALNSEVWSHFQSSVYEIPLHGAFQFEWKDLCWN